MSHRSHKARQPAVSARDGRKAVCEAKSNNDCLRIDGECEFRSEQSAQPLGCKARGDIAKHDWPDVPQMAALEAAAHHTEYAAERRGVPVGADEVVIQHNEQAVDTKIQDRRKMGKKNHIIVNAEGIGNSNEMAKVIELATGVETRATILGHIQRGGNPTCKDRVYASAMGARAVELLCEGASNRVVGYHNGEFKDYDIQEALAMTKGLDPYLFHIMKKLTTRG